MYSKMPMSNESGCMCVYVNVCACVCVCVSVTGEGKTLLLAVLLECME